MFEDLDDASPPEPSEQHRHAVIARGRDFIRRRRQLQVGSALVALLLVVAVPAVIARSGGGGSRAVHTIGGPSTSTSEEPSTTEAPTTEVPTTVAPPTTVPPSTTTSLLCHNSHNPACGPFRWDPPPGANQPVTVSVSYTPAQPKTGEKVTFLVTASDPDSPATGTEGGFEYGDRKPGSAGGWAAEINCDEPTRYGPWTPPAPSPGKHEQTYSYVYNDPGTYKATFNESSDGSCPDHDPYGSGLASGSVTVTVVGPPVSTTTTVP